MSFSLRERVAEERSRVRENAAFAAESKLMLEMTHTREHHRHIFAVA